MKFSAWSAKVYGFLMGLTIGPYSLTPSVQSDIVDIELMPTAMSLRSVSKLNSLPFQNNYFFCLKIFDTLEDNNFWRSSTFSWATSWRSDFRHDPKLWCSFLCWRNSCSFFWFAPTTIYQSALEKKLINNVFYDWFDFL